MPVCVLTRNSQIPAHLTSTSISAICIGPDWTDAIVKGKVVHKDALVPLDDDDFILKAVIQDVDSSANVTSQEMSIKMLMMGSLAKDFCRTVNLGDVVVASGFTVSKSSSAKEKLHPCTLLLSGEDACIYVCHPEVDSVETGKRPPKAAEEPRQAKKTKYTYCRLDELEVGRVVNVYGVVVFFKQPFKTNGKDYCSSIKITDQSDQRIGCNIFLAKLEEHPNIFEVGDIIRMHRVKVFHFNNSVTLVSTHGFSAVTFDGTAGEPVEPRTSSRNFHFDADDQRTVEELRTWATGQDLLRPPPSMTLSMVQPRAYFDLTCQLLAKAPIDSSCMLLRVWDGTRCPHALLKVLVEPGVTEGPTSFSSEQEHAIANVLVYDNHVEVARQLKLGDFLKIYNLRAIPGSSKVPGLTESQPEELEHLAFHLHGGTTYGRGIRVLPDNSPNVKELKRIIEAFRQDEDDFDMMDVWVTPPETTDTEPVSADSITETTCRHNIDPVTLAEVKRSNPGQYHHVKVQLKSYQPQKLHQSLKLFCDKCSTMQDVPDEDHVSQVFSAALHDRKPCFAPAWALSGQVHLPSDSAGPSALSLYFSPQLMSEGKNKQLMFIKGASLEQVKKLSASYLNIVPVQSSEGQLTLLDLSAPVLFRGRRRYYGCKKCSNPAVREPNVEGVEVVSEKLLAEALGVELLRYVLLLRLQLHDSSGSLDVLLWRDTELFFNVSAADAASNQEAQNHICQTMASLCPPEGSTALRPWMNMCLVSYQAKDDGGNNQTVYQICHTNLSITTPEPDPT